jgi:hypothetical protein
MRYFVIKSKDLGNLVKAIIAANEDNVEYELKMNENELWITEFEAFRTGIQNLRTVLSPRKCYLRSCWYHFNNSGKPTQLSMYDTGTRSNLKIIDSGYKRPVKIFGSVTEAIYTCGNYSIFFDKNTREPYLGYHIYTSDRNPSIKMLVKDFVNTSEEDFYSRLPRNGFFNQEEFKIIKKIINHLVKY